MPDRLITVEPVEPDLTAERVDERLAQGFFPWGQQWMTCRAWPVADGPRDTIWVRVRLAARRPSDRHRRLIRAGWTTSLHPGPVLDDEHQRLYETFRATRHPGWTEHARSLLLHREDPSPLLHRTREIALRDPAGRLAAFRWFLEGKDSIAGISSVYDTSHDGLGTIARALADQWAMGRGVTYSYPGYVWPGAVDPWYYKIKPGRTEWLDPDHGRWRPWDGAGPDPETLVLAEIRSRLRPLGEIHYYGGWAAPCVDPASRGLSAPYFVIGAVDGADLTVIVWSVEHGAYQELRVHVERTDGGDAAEPPAAGETG